MGVFMDFLTGKNAPDSSLMDRMPEPRRYYAVCRYCGQRVSGDSDPGTAIRLLQRTSLGCGRDCHTPMIIEE